MRAISLIFVIAVSYSYSLSAFAIGGFQAGVTTLNSGDFNGIGDEPKPIYFTYTKKGGRIWSDIIAHSFRLKQLDDTDGKTIFTIKTISIDDGAYTDSYTAQVEVFRSPHHPDNGVITVKGLSLSKALSQLSHDRLTDAAPVLPFPMIIYRRDGSAPPQIGAVNMGDKAQTPTVALKKFAEFLNVPLTTPAYGQKLNIIGSHNLKRITITSVGIDIYGDVTLRYEVEYADTRVFNFVHITAPIDRLEKAKFSWLADIEYMGFAEDKKRPSELNGFVEAIKRVFGGYNDCPGYLLPGHLEDVARARTAR